MKKFKKHLSLFMALLLLVSTIPIVNFADGATLAWSDTEFLETTDDGTVGTVINLELTGDTFTMGDGPMTLDTHYSVSNVPTGSAVVVTKVSATTATVELSGTATAHSAANDISNMNITFLDAAFTGGGAAGIAGSTQTALEVTFFDDVAPTVGTPTIVATPGSATVGLSWTAATDNRDAQNLLQYKLVKSSSNNVGTVSDAEANGTVVTDWTANIASSNATGLTENSTYYFAVLVKDTASNKSLYTVKTQNTLRGAISSLGGLDGTELFLGGNYIEIGISNWGDLGTEGNKPAGFRGTDGGEGGNGTTKVGMSADFDGYNNGHDKPIDFYLPGTREERFVVGYKVGATTTSKSNSALMNTKQMPTVVTDLSDTEEGILKAQIVSTWDSTMEITQVISFKVNDKFYKNSVTLKNTSASSWDGARYMRTFDPDNTVFRGGGSSTDNTVTHTVAEDGKAVVKAQTYSDADLIYTTFGSRAPIFFYSQDPSAVASTFGFTNTNPYDASAYDTPRAKSDTLRADAGITITFDTGVLAAGASKTFVYYTSLDERDFSTVEQEINDDIAEEEDDTPAVVPEADDDEDRQPKNEAVIVIVNGVEQNAGTETKSTENGDSVVTVEVKPEVIEQKIEDAIKANDGTEDNVLQVPVADLTSDIARVELTGDIVKKLEDNAFDISIKRNDVEYIIPAEELTIENVAAELGVNTDDLKDIKIEVEFKAVSDEVIKQYEELAAANGDQLIFPPMEFNVTAKTTGTDGKISKVTLDKFSNYVERVMEIPAGVDPSKITTGIVFNADGTYEHVPTVVFEKDGKWFAKLSSLTNSNYSVVWHPITVSSVENHWSKVAVNDMASRLVIANPDTFIPDASITRAEFAEYLVKALGLYRIGIAKDLKYSDVSSTNVYQDAIFQADAYGLIKGYADGTYRPEAKISRQEAMGILARAMTITNLEGTNANGYAAFTDFVQASNWAVTELKALLSTSVLQGRSEALLNPRSEMTYAEAAQAIRSLLIESGLINK